MLTQVDASKGCKNVLIRDEARVMIVNVGREDEMGIESNSKKYAVSFIPEVAKMKF